MEKFKAETGKNAIWRDKITKGYTEWKNKQGRPKKRRTSTIKKGNKSVTIEIQSNIQKIFTKLENFENRLSALEKKLPESKEVKKFGKVSDDHFFRILNSAYNSSEKKFGDFISVSALTDKIKEFIPWPTEKIHSELYKLFMNYKIDLQPGKKVEGIPLIQDGKTFVWFKLK